VRPLRRRANLILSSQTHEEKQMRPDQSEQSVQSEHWFRTVPDLFAHLDAANYDEVWIIGGASIYEQFLAMHATGEINIDEMCVTTMEGVYSCDTFFPLMHPILK
jgi:dihydrofolate reductase